VRGSAREEALRILYEADQRPAVDEAGSDHEADSRGGGRAGRIARGVRSERESLDAALESASANWRVARMAPIDRTILRIGLYELRHEPGTSVGTIIDEAVELAKRYSTEQSGGFVNGVLAALARRERPEETTGALEAGG
jgi:N utilization substance protein B